MCIKSGLRHGQSGRYTPVELVVAMAGSEFIVTRTAQEWSVIVGLKWETVKKRRQRGYAWHEALIKRRMKVGGFGRTFLQKNLHQTGRDIA